MISGDSAHHLSTWVSLCEVCGMRGNAVGHEALLHVELVRQAKMLL